jgi:hypothetical protein
MSSVKLKHSSGNGTIINAPAANPSADITLKVPSTTGSAGQVLSVASANHSSTNAELEWAAAGGTGRKVLEQFYSPCDGSVIAASAGNITIGDVDAAVDQTTSYVDIPGSSITYTPPTGATQVIYEYRFHWGAGDSIPLFNMKLSLAGTEVSEARSTQYAANRDQEVYFKWAFNIGGSGVDATGRVASWSSGKEIKLQGREYGASNEVTLFKIYYWDGSTNQAIFTRPSVGITAIG